MEPAEVPGSGTARVALTQAAAELLVKLTALHGPLMFHQSGGCCDGSAPMCYPDGDFKLGGSDVHLGDLTVPGLDKPIGFHMSESQYEYWKHTHLTVDVVKGRGSGFSVEAPEGVRFLIRSRLFTDDESGRCRAARPSLHGNGCWFNHDVSSVRPVPETGLMTGDELSAEDAWSTARRHGLRALLAGAFVRFRYGDGFSHARAFALQLALAAVPLVIAGAGLASAIGARSAAEVVARTVVAISPGRSDALVADVVSTDDEGTERAEVVVALALVTAFLAATSAFAQLERGANRIYGTERDRPALRKYGRGAVLTATAGVAMAAGLLLIVAGEPFGDALEAVYRWGDAAETVWRRPALAGRACCC